MKIVRFIFVLFLTLIPYVSFAQKSDYLTGQVLDASNKKPIPFATLYIVESGKGGVADINGMYSLMVKKKKDYHIRVNSMGFASRTILVKKEKNQLIILLEEQSVGLKDFTVTAKYQNRLGSDATVGQEALEYIQPTSLKDIFTLLPGGTLGSNNMQSGELISSRQAGADLSTSFGMGISVNGVPVHNDGMRVQLSGLTGRVAMDADGNMTVNAGVDMRTISTDHVEKVTVTKGISSAKEGNLSSGLVKINIKKGAGPLRARVKFDPKNKLLYVGKGLNLGDSKGVLYVGMDVVRSISRIEDTRGAYNRITGQINYNNKSKLAGKNIDVNVHASYVTSFNNRKSDEIIEILNEKYTTQYQRASLSSKFNIDLNHKVIDDLEFILSTDYTSSQLRHNKHVMNQTVIPLQQSLVEGESEGIYLPSTYNTFYRIDNQPINLFTQLTAQKFSSIRDKINYRVIVGGTFNYTKNVGEGAITDPMRPPFPSKDFIRPRSNKDIPALVNQATYVETKWRYRADKNEFNASLGIREEMMLNLPSDYDLYQKVLLQPRLQGAYTLNIKINNRPMSNTIRIGFGVENKLPSADYLYPDKVYQDYIALNAYFNDKDKRLLITNTKIQSIVNKHLRENKNKKIELGYDWKYNGYVASFTVFRENMSNGIEYFDVYTPTSYTYYYELKYDVDYKPSREDFKSRLVKTFMLNSIPTNSAKVLKNGVEYRFHIPTIESLSSEVEINGAYYKTLYTAGVPVMYRPAIMSGNKMYPYVGLFDGYEKRYSSIFNTNFWINTHLPKWKLIFTDFIQIIWFEKTRLGTDVDVYPTRYMDTDGKINVLDASVLDEKPELKSLKRDFLSSRYNETQLPISLLWNLKLTKEFSKQVKLSFFADKILVINPKYRNAYYKTRRSWHRPFFGAELTINIF